MVDVPAPGQPVEVPGVATISVGGASRSAGAGGASAAIDTLKIAVAATGTTTTVGHAVAAIRPGVVTGVFGGYSSGTRGEAGDGTLTSGRTPNLVMPCQGTGGHVRTRSITQTRLAGGLLVQGLSTRQLADQDARRAHGYEQARIAGIDLGDGKLKVAGIVGRVNVERLRNGTLRRNISGTTLGTITVNGQTETMPAAASSRSPAWRGSSGTSSTGSPTACT